MNRKTLFSVIQAEDGTLQVMWHPDLYPRLDSVSPNGEMTDRIIDIAEELMAEPCDDADEEVV